MDNYGDNCRVYDSNGVVSIGERLEELSSCDGRTRTSDLDQQSNLLQEEEEIVTLVSVGVGIAQTNFFFAGWKPIVRIVVAGTAMYISLLIFLRLSGSRTVASMTVFDFIVTVAIGAAFGGSLTAKAIPLAEAVTAFGLLVGLQYAVAWIGTRWPRFRRGVTNRPVFMYFHGEFSQEAMQDARLTETELRATVRKRGIGSMDDVEAIILEPAGDVSVITSIGDGSALPEIAGDRPYHLDDD